MTKHTRTKREWKELHDQYLHGKSVKELAKELNIHVQTVYSGFTRHGFIRSVGFVNHAVKDSYFKNFDSCTEAYAFGLWLADGTLGKNQWSIKLHSKDAYVLEQISSDFYLSPRRLQLEANTALLIGCSKTVTARLRELVGKNKTERLNLNIDSIPTERIPAILRGVFDGDGTIYKTKANKKVAVNICSISKAFLETIQGWLLANAGIQSKIYIEKRSHIPSTSKTEQGGCAYLHDMYRLIFGTLDSRVKLFELLYNRDNGPRLQRKYDLFKQHHDNAVQLLACKKPALPDSSVSMFHAQHVQGRSIRDIGKQLNRSASTVAHWFRSHGLEVRSRVTHRD